MNSNAFLEDSQGKTIKNPTPEQIQAKVAKIGAGLDFCTLNFGDEFFIQAAGDHNRLFLQYRDAAGMHESTEANFDNASVAKIFVAALNGQTGWKQDFSFSPTGPSQGPSQEVKGPEDQKLGFGEAVKKGVMDAARWETTRAARRTASRGISSIIKKFLK